MNNKRRNIIIAIFVALLVSATMAVLLWCNATDEFDEWANRTENDYVTKIYTVDNIWERSINSGSTTKYKYNYITLQGEDFSLSLPYQNRNIPKYASLLEEGEEIEVKLYEPELEEMQSKSVWKIIQRFFAADNREVEVYSLKIGGETIFDKEITRSDINFRKGGDLRVFPIMVVFGILVVIAAIVGRVREKKKHK